MPANAKDLYLQFDGATVTSDAANATTLVTDSIIQTGLSIRGMLVFLVHYIECLWVAPSHVTALQGQPRLVLSTVEDLAAMPSINDKGSLCAFGYDVYLLTQGAAAGCEALQTRHYLPPVPIAAPSLTMYLAFTNDAAGWRSNAFQWRICFTTAPMDKGMYTEIAETWGW